MPHTVWCTENDPYTSAEILQCVDHGPKGDEDNVIKGAKTVIFILSGHGHGSGSVSTLVLGKGNTLSLGDLYGRCRAAHVEHVMFIADMCRSYTEQSGVARWARGNPDVVVIEAAKRHQTAGQVQTQGLLSGVAIEKTLQTGVTTPDAVLSLCIDIVQSAAGKMRAHFESLKIAEIHKIGQSVQQVWGTSFATALRIWQEAIQYYISHFLPQVYMTERLHRTLSAEQMTILRQATGVSVGSLHAYQVDRIQGTISGR